jgi:hypothetical protein
LRASVEFVGVLLCLGHREAHGRRRPIVARSGGPAINAGDASPADLTSAVYSPRICTIDVGDRPDWQSASTATLGSAGPLYGSTDVAPNRADHEKVIPMFHSPSYVVLPDDQRSLREATLSLEPREILGRLSALETLDLGPDERAGLLREVAGWERYIARLAWQCP